MTYMEIATYLGAMNMALKDSYSNSIDDKLTAQVHQAVCEAQMIMYELAKQEMLKALEAVTNDYSK